MIFVYLPITFLNIFFLFNSNTNNKNYNLKLFFLILTISCLVSKIGGDYAETVTRAFNTDFSLSYFLADPIASVAILVQNYLRLDAPKFFSIIIILLLYNFVKIYKSDINYTPLGSLLIFIYIITGFQRQGLSIIILLYGLYYIDKGKIIYAIFFILLSLLTHKSSLFLIIIFILLSNYFNKIFLFFIFLFLLLTSSYTFEYLQNLPVVSHFVNAYLINPMVSDGAIFRFITLCFLFLLIDIKKIFYACYTFFLSNNNSLRLYDKLILTNLFILFSSMFMLIIGRSTASDRLLLFSYITIPLLIADSNNRIRTLIFILIESLYIYLWLYSSKYAHAFWL